MHPSALAGAFAAPAVKHNLGSVSGFTISLLRGWQRFSESARIPRMPPGCARLAGCGCWISPVLAQASGRSEEHTSELQSLMRISYAVFCLKKKTQHIMTLYLSQKHISI